LKHSRFQATNIRTVSMKRQYISNQLPNMNVGTNMKWYFQILALALLLPAFSYGQIWRTSFGFRTASNNIAAMRCDDSGFVWMAGCTYDSLSISTSMVRSNGYNDCFIMKTDTTGSPLFIRTFGSVRLDAIKDMVLKSDGNQIITGTFQQSMIVGDSVIEAPSTESMFLMELGLDSTPLWSTTATAYCGSALAVSDNNDIFVAGEFNTSAYFPPFDTIECRGEMDIFLAGYTPRGSVKWVVPISGRHNDAVYSLRLYDNELLYIAGQYMDTLFIADDTLLAESSEPQAFIACFDTSGTMLWNMALASAGSVHLKALINDSEGNLYVTGKYSDVLKIDTMEFPQNDESAMFLVKLSPEGGLIWMKKVERACGNRFTLTDSAGLLLCSDFQRFATFDEYQVNAIDIQDVFIAEYSPDGTCDWVLTAGGCRASHAWQIASRTPYVYLCGSAEADLVNRFCPMNFGQNPLLFEATDPGRTFFSFANYLLEPGSVRKPARRHSLSIRGGANSAVRRCYDLLGRNITPTQPATRGRIGAASGTVPSVIIIESDGILNRSVLIP